MNVCDDSFFGSSREKSHSMSREVSPVPWLLRFASCYRSTWSAPPESFDSCSGLGGGVTFLSCWGPGGGVTFLSCWGPGGGVTFLSCWGPGGGVTFLSSGWNKAERKCFVHNKRQEVKIAKRRKQMRKDAHSTLNILGLSQYVFGKDLSVGRQRNMFSFLTKVPKDSG